jgi:hexokinase
MEANMTCISARSARIGFVTVVATILTAGICGDALAKVHKGRVHVHGPVYESRAQLAPQAPAQPGAMRYYGGPKSPMSRGPTGN